MTKRTHIPPCISIKWSIQFGEACLTGTRIPIRIIRGYYDAQAFCDDYYIEDREWDIILIRSLTHGQLTAIGIREAKEYQKAKEYWKSYKGGAKK